MRLLSARLLACVIGLQHGGVCWAGDATAAEVTGTMYGGAGPTSVENNERASRYDERHFGVGALGVLRPWGNRGEAKDDALGGFLQLGLVGEMRSHQLIDCGIRCRGDDERRGFIPEAHVGVRPGIGYDFRVVGVRGGVLFADSPAPRLAETLLFPDVQLRLGPRSHGWFELGLGAYDASTTLRPGLYVGGAVVAGQLTFSTHYGWHTATGNFGDGVFQVGGRFDFGAEYALSRHLRLGAGVSLSNASQFGTFFDFTRAIVEGRGQAAFTF